MSHYHADCSIVHRPEIVIHNLNFFFDAYKTESQRSRNLSTDRETENGGRTF